MLPNVARCYRMLPNLPHIVCSGFSHLSLIRSRFLFFPPSLFGDQRTCARTARWGCTAGLRYAAPCETVDQMVLLRTVLNFSMLSIFLVFRIVGFSSSTCRASAFLPEFFQYDGILCVLVLCNRIQRNQTIWQFKLVVSTWQW